MFGSGDGFIRCSDGHVRWGRFGAAGVLFVVDGDDGAHVMLQLRSGFAHEGGTWSCSGGALDFGESPLDGALREACEEVGIPEGPLTLLGQYVFEPADDWTYTTVVIGLESRFGDSQNFETDAVEWVHVDQVHKRPLHSGFAHAWPHLREIVEAAAGASTA